MKKYLLLYLFLSLVLSFNRISFSQTISWGSIPAGYEAGSIDLGEPFKDSLTPTNDPNYIYVSVGKYYENKIKKVNLSNGVSIDVTDAVFGSIGGMTTLPTGELIIVDNDDNTTSPIPGECVLIAKDLNSDGDFKDDNEINKLIDPILVETLWGGFSGAQARTAPSGNPANIPSGSLLFQDADGSGKGDLFVVTNPTSSTSAAFRPTGASFFRGFDYNGGFDFDSNGVIYSGSTTSDFHGTVFALKNLNNDEDIDAGESNDIVTTSSLFYSGVCDLVVDKEDDVLFAAATYPIPSILTFKSSLNPLNESISPTTFASINANWISAIHLNTKEKSFEPNTGADGAILIVSGYAAGWLSAKNILTLKPKDISEVKDWNLYK